MLTYSLAEAAERIGGCSTHWLANGIRAGKFPARKIAGKWRMTEADIAAVMDVVANPFVPPHPSGLSLTRTSRRRLA